MTIVVDLGRKANKQTKNHIAFAHKGQSDIDEGK